ncbi:hypothetical protein BCR34DRAFT_478114 [Clohesyomyces aquaticus]|uniref:BZIP transcription factor n=1 Tax=Clohesyomyces aquaticus TaxID=1231657 RepID=A0A1Y1ZYH4_9PLEO|nr:hypothetical protein BCR34DRAFT_478114 [Clohesyomyces aquaticus]
MAEADDDRNGDAAGSDAPDASQAQPQNGQKRRRTQGTASTRGVANLTPEQLARKRANDREAQRAIRERTKNQIDRLNQRIRELESQQPYHDLQVVLREKEAVQADNIDIRKRLEHVVSLIQPILRTSGLNELAAAAERSPLPLPLPGHPSSSATDPRAFHRGLVSINEAVSPHAPSVHNAAAAHSPGPPDAARQWLFPGDAPTSHVRRWSGESPQFEHVRPPEIRSEIFDERMGVDFLLDSTHRRVDPNLPPPRQPPPSNGVAAQHAPQLIPHLTLPKTAPPTCPLDVIMLDFLADRKVLAAQGEPIKALVGPYYPNFTALVYPDRNVDAHPLSRLFTDILRTFPDICGLPEQVAIVFIMFLIMRWQVEPTQENYDRLPDWVTPRASQLFTPHSAWIDHLPWPRLRDRCIAQQPPTPFDAFFIPFTTTVSLNWPYEPRDCLLPASKISASSLSATSSMPASSPYSTAVHAGSPPGPPTPGPAVSTPGTVSATGKEDEQWLINPAFESHLRDLKNWSLGPAFRTTFPHYADAVRVKEGR